MSVGGRVYSSFSTPEQLIPTVSGGSSSALIPNAHLEAAITATTLPNTAAITKIIFDATPRDVLVNVVDSAVEILESGTYSIVFSAVCSASSDNGNYSTITTYLEASSVSAPTVFSPFADNIFQALDGAGRAFIQISRIQALEAGQFIRVTAAVDATAANNVIFGIPASIRKTTLSLVKVAPYFDNN
jgi:hypothetical protein